MKLVEKFVDKRTIFIVLPLILLLYAVHRPIVVEMFFFWLILIDAKGLLIFYCHKIALFPRVRFGRFFDVGFTALFTRSVKKFCTPSFLFFF